MAQFPKPQWQPEHVEGHKDEESPFEKLTAMQQLNVLADNRAKACLRLLVKDMKSELREHCSGQGIKDHWTSRGHFGEAAAEDVDWEVTHRAMKSMTKGQRREVTKHVAHCFSAGINMKRWKQRASSQCCRCGAPTEDGLHVMRCPCLKATEAWEKSVNTLCTWMRNNDANPDVANVVCS
jgi:hypothetical protein